MRVASPCIVQQTPPCLPLRLAACGLEWGMITVFARQTLLDGVDWPLVSSLLLRLVTLVDMVDGGGV